MHRHQIRTDKTPPRKMRASIDACSSLIQRSPRAGYLRIIRPAAAVALVAATMVVACANSRTPGAVDMDGRMIDSGADGQRCPTYPELDYADGPWSTDPSRFDAKEFGCHSERVLAPADWLAPAANPPGCGGTTFACTYEPSALPCSTCKTEGAICAMSVWAPCNLGRGPFIDNYWDEWTCHCSGGIWDCRVTAPSGSSCFEPQGPTDGGGSR
jgi:hypothetical protein